MQHFALTQSHTVSTHAVYSVVARSPKQWRSWASRFNSLICCGNWSLMFFFTFCIYVISLSLLLKREILLQGSGVTDIQLWRASETDSRLSIYVHGVCAWGLPGKCKPCIHFWSTRQNMYWSVRKLPSWNWAPLTHSCSSIPLVRNWRCQKSLTEAAEEKEREIYRSWLWCNWYFKKSVENQVCYLLSNSELVS